MIDDRSLDDFAGYLKKKGWPFETRGPENGLRFYIVKDYHILNGTNTGKNIAVAFPIPLDYPSTAPYGIHLLRSQGIAGGNASALGGEWGFLSRRIVGWDSGKRNAQYYIDNVNRWLE